MEEFEKNEPEKEKSKRKGKKSKSKGDDEQVESGSEAVKSPRSHKHSGKEKSYDNFELNDGQKVKSRDRLERDKKDRKKNRSASLDSEKTKRRPKVGSTLSKPTAWRVAAPDSKSSGENADRSPLLGIRNLGDLLPEASDRSNQNGTIHNKEKRYPSLVDYFALIGCNGALVEDKHYAEQGCKNHTEEKPDFGEAVDSGTEDRWWTYLENSCFRPDVIDRYPRINQEKITFPPHIWMFCFPSGCFLKRSSQLNEVPFKNEYMDFVLTEMDGTRFYGACIIFYETIHSKLIVDFINTKKSGTPFKPETELSYTYYFPKAICLLSRQPVIRVLLECCKEIKDRTQPLEYAVHRICKEIPAPAPGFRCNFTFGAKSFAVTTPHSYIPPSLDSNISNFLKMLGPEQFLFLFESLLNEQKILLYSSSYDKLVKFAEGLSSLLYPFAWHFVYIPILPKWLLEFIQAPTPYIMGVHESYYRFLPSTDFPIVHVNLDNWKVEYKVDDTSISTHTIVHLPTEYRNKMKAELEAIHEIIKVDGEKLKTGQSSNSNILIQRLFLCDIFVELFHDYTQYVSFLKSFPEPLAVFDTGSFLADLHKKSPSLDDFTSFVTMFVESQAFSNFLGDHQQKCGNVMFDFLSRLRDLITDPNKIRSVQCKSIEGKEANIINFTVQERSGGTGSQNRRKAAVIQHKKRETTTFPALEKSLIRLAEQETSSPGDPHNFDENIFCTDEDPLKNLPKIEINGVPFDFATLPKHLQPGFRASLEYLKKQKSSFSTEENSKKNEAGAKFMHDRIKQVMDATAIAGPNLAILQDMLKLDYGRALFVSEIDTEKKNAALKKECFDMLSELTSKCLAEAEADADIKCSIHILRIATSYHYIDPKTQQSIYLTSTLKGHSFWRNKRFWETAFFEELTNARQSLPFEITGICPTSTDKSVPIAKWSSLTAATQQHYMNLEEETLFHVLSALAMHMIEVGIQIADTRKFIQQMCILSDLSVSRTDTLEILLENIARANELSTMDMLKFCPNKENPSSKQTLLDHWSTSASTRKQMQQGLTKELYQRLMEYQRTNLRSDTRVNLAQCLRQSALIDRNQLLVSSSLQRAILPTEIVKEKKDGYEVFILKGHESAIDILETDPSVMVSGSADGIVMVWDHRTGVCYRQLPGHSTKITAIAFDEDHLLTGGSDREIKLWHTQSGRFEGSVTAHTGSITKLILSQDSSHSQYRANVLSAAYDNSIKLWDTRNFRGKHIGELNGHTGPVMDCVWKDHLVVSCSRDTTVRLWDIRNMQSLKTYIQHDDWVSKIRLYGDYIVSASFDCSIRVRNIVTDAKREPMKGHTGSINAISVQESDLDLRILSASGDGTAKIWCMPYDEEEAIVCEKTFRGHDDEVVCAEWLSDGRVVSCSYDKTVRIWDPETVSCKVLRGHSDWITNMKVFKDRIVTSSLDNSLRIWKFDLNKSVPSISEEFKKKEKKSKKKK